MKTFEQRQDCALELPLAPCSGFHPRSAAAREPDPNSGGALSREQAPSDRWTEEFRRCADRSKRGHALASLWLALVFALFAGSGILLTYLHSSERFQLDLSDRNAFGFSLALIPVGLSASMVLYRALTSASDRELYDLTSKRLRSLDPSLKIEPSKFLPQSDFDASALFGEPRTEYFGNDLIAGRLAIPLTQSSRLTRSF